jgi:hypothetical protein
VPLFETAQSKVPGSQKELFCAQMVRIGPGDVLIFKFLGGAFDERVSILCKSARSGKKKSFMPGGLRKHPFDQFQSEWGSGSDQLKIVVRVIDVTRPREGISNLVEHGAMYGTAAKGRNDEAISYDAGESRNEVQIWSRNTEN